MKYENEIGSKGEQSSLPQASLRRTFHETVRKNSGEGCATVESGERSFPLRHDHAKKESSIAPPETLVFLKH